MYDEKVEGITVRSPVRWHEHGKKNYKYFLHLEKRNHIKKHLRKLNLGGIITSDRFEILCAEKEFYEGLYKSYHNCVQQGGASFNYEDPQIPKLLKECKRLGEGGNTLEEDSRGR